MSATPCTTLPIPAPCAACPAAAAALLLSSISDQSPEVISERVTFPAGILVSDSYFAPLALRVRTSERPACGSNWQTRLLVSLRSTSVLGSTSLRLVFSPSVGWAGQYSRPAD